MNDKIVAVQLLWIILFWGSLTYDGAIELDAEKCDIKLYGLHRSASIQKFVFENDLFTISWLSTG